LKPCLNLSDTELDLAIEYTWLDPTLPIRNMDETTYTVSLASPAIYTVKAYRVGNVLDVLDESNEWCVDSHEGVVSGCRRKPWTMRRPWRLGGAYPVDKEIAIIQTPQHTQQVRRYAYGVG
jgi:hypothetical protein